MTDIEKQIFIAEHCGWTRHETCVNSVAMPGWDYFTHPRYGETKFDISYLLSLSASIDAIRAAVLMQSEEFQDAFDDSFMSSTRTNYLHQLTASDWCDIFIEVKQKEKGKA